VSIGTVGGERQLTNVAAGTEDTDAVNLGQLNSALTAMGAESVLQLQSIAAVFGGGATIGADGMLSAPTYGIQGGSYYNVGDAFGAVDSALAGFDSALANFDSALASFGDTLSSLTTRVTDVENRPIPEGGSHIPVGTGDGLAIGENSHAADASDTAVGTDATVGAENGVALGNGATVTADATNSVALGAGSLANEANTVSVGSAGNERRVTNVAAGTASTDAANVGQMQAGDAQTLATANAYTDSKMQAWSDQFNDITTRLQKQDARIDQQGAMSAAMLNMAINAANSRSDRGRIGVGAGWQNGEGAMSIGYSKQIGDRASFSIGGAFSSDDSSAGVGFGIDH
jgi:autotransporter adhesin